MLRIDDGRVDVGEDLELVGDAKVVAVGRQTIRDHAFAHLRLGEGVDHVVFFGHFADPAVALEHGTP